MADLPSLRAVEELERIHGFKIDAILPDGTHRYWSTHCRHAKDANDPGHEACSAKELIGSYGVDLDGGGSYRVRTAMDRKPAQCKTCAARCVCPCHGGD